MPNYSHGTAGVATALAVAGAALNRQDFVHAATLGAQHLLAVGSLDDDGFIVAHTIPPSTREVDPVTYNWCHGSAGTSYLFAALAHAGVAEVAGLAVAGLRQRCLHSILTSGVPRRIRPGFWDNDGRCCGTAGVGEALLDAVQDYVLRLTRVIQDEPSAPVVDRPDQWWAVPTHLRTAHTPPRTAAHVAGV